MKEVAAHVDKFKKRRFVSVDFLDFPVNDYEFVIKFSYNKDQLEHLIQEFAQELFDELKRSKLYCWAVHRPLVEEIETPDEYLLEVVKIIILRETRNKKMSSIHSSFQEFKQTSVIQNAVIFYDRKDDDFILHICCLQKESNIEKEKKIN